MKRFSVLVAVCISSLLTFAQTDPVLMTINGKQITRSEFEYSFNKNNSDGVIDKKSIVDYVPLFINFKLKVAAAEEAKFDTLASIQKDLRSYREQMLLPTIVDSEYIENEARATYKNTASHFAGQDILTASHIFVLMRQDATEAQQTAAKVRIDSIYQALLKGADFETLAKQCSDDKASAVKGGTLGQFGKGMMIPDFETAAYALKPGEMSAPVKTTAGWHIIKLQDRHPFESYEFHHDKIMKFLEQRGIKEASANYYIDSIAKLRKVERDVVVTDMFKDMIAKDSEMRNLSQEYYDGTLMYEICKTQIWDVASKDDAGIAKYYAKNKKKYTWDSPRFKGIVINSKSREIVDASKKLLKKEKDDTKWGQILIDKFNTDSVKNVRIEHGIYKQGDNQNVDVKIFGVSKELKPLKDYSVIDVYGKLLKKPETYKDVRGQVVADYQTAKEQEWVEGLRQKYTFSVNEDVLKTVNNHD